MALESLHNSQLPSAAAASPELQPAAQYEAADSNSVRCTCSQDDVLHIGSNFMRFVLGYGSGPLAST